MWLGSLGTDAGTTLYGITHGYHESNPLYNVAGDRAAVPLMIGLDLATRWLGHKLLADRHPTLLKALTYAGSAMHGAAAARNFRTFATTTTDR